MSRIVVIVGLPGSGKTHLGEQMAKELNCLFVDDVSYSCAIQGLYDLFINLAKHPVSVIADPQLCVSDNRRYAQRLLTELGFDVEWIFFENDTFHCLANCTGRGKDNTRVDIQVLCQFYDIPEGEDVRPVWKAEQ